MDWKKVCSHTFNSYVTDGSRFPVFLFFLLPLRVMAEIEPHCNSRFHFLIKFLPSFILQLVYIHVFLVALFLFSLLLLPEYQTDWELI